MINGMIYPTRCSSEHSYWTAGSGDVFAVIYIFRKSVLQCFWRYTRCRILHFCSVESRSLAYDWSKYMWCNLDLTSHDFHWSYYLSHISAAVPEIKLSELAESIALALVTPPLYSVPIFHPIKKALIAACPERAAMSAASRSTFRIKRGAQS